MFLGKEVRVILKGQAKESFIELKKRTDKGSKILVRSIERTIELLKDNPQFGDPIAKDLIPDKIKEQEVKNIYRVELSNFWRMIYTLEGTNVEVFCFVLNIVDHPTYDKLFGYKGR